MALMQIQQLRFTYPGAARPALSNVTLEIEKGGFVVLCGTTGSGKSTLLRHMKPELAPHGRRQGEILFRGESLARLSPVASASLVGYVMQDPDAQIVTDTVWHELAFGLENLGYETGVIRRRVAEMASFFGIEAWFRRACSTLSSGQKQTLALASVMAMQPELLILDEPTAQLDPIAAYEFLGLLERIHREIGTTVVIAEHRLEETLPLAELAVVMDAGEAVCIAPPGRIGLLLPQAAAGRGEALRRMTAGLPAATRVAMAARQADPQAGSPGPVETLPLTPREGHTWLAARPLPAEEPGEETPGMPEPAPHTMKQRPVLSAREVWFRYNRDDADILRGLSIDLLPGQIHAVLGGNGTGKSTLLSLLRGLLRARRGRIVSTAGSKSGTGDKPGAGNQSGIVLLGADPRALFVHETVRRELKETASEHPERVESLVHAFGLESLLDRHPMDLSSGEGQKVALAMALSRNPDVLLLDEPTRGLDPAARETLQGILRGLAEEGRAVLMVTHDVEFAATASDICSLLFDGEIVSSGPPTAFFAGNRFYTTAANRMARAWRPGIVTVEDLLACWGIAPPGPEAVPHSQGGPQ